MTRPTRILPAVALLLWLAIGCGDGDHRVITLTPVRTEDELAQSAGCADRGSDLRTAECYHLLAAAEILQRAYATKRWPADAEVSGIDIAAVGPRLERVGYDEGYFRGPGVSYFRLLPSKLEVAYCCGKLKGCPTGHTSCGCIHDCNGE